MLLDGYIRVSEVRGREGESFISPSVQREEIEGWTRSHGAVVGEVFEEMDESGARANRPLLRRAIGRVESGESEGIVVAKFDRFARSVVDGLRSIARIEAAGGTFVSVEDGVDLSTPTGKLVARTLFSIGEWELDRMRSSWDIAIGRAIERGIYVGREGPFGYRRSQDRRLRIEPEEAELVKEVFARRRRGASYDELAEFLNGSGIKPRRGASFNRPMMMRIVSDPAYRGEAYSGSHHNRSAHEPIIDAASWQECQGLPMTQTNRLGGLAAGLIRCASCGRAMAAPQPASSYKGSNSYSCRTADGSCAAPAHVAAEELDPLIEEFIFQRRDRTSVGPSPAVIKRCQAAVEKCRAAAEATLEDLDAYGENPRLKRTLGAQSFEAGMAKRQRLNERALLELARARRAMEEPGLDLGVSEAGWKEMSREERCGVVRELVDYVVIEAGSGPASERAWLFRRGRGPLPGEARERLREFKRGGSGASKLPGTKPWSRKRLAKELGEFLAGREVWPEYGEFADAGLGRLHAQTLAWGGPYYWGGKFGVRVPRGIVKWNETKVHDALAPFLKGREKWPSLQEFEAAGMGPVCFALRYHGGAEIWAGRFGLRYKKQPRPWSEERIERELAEFLAGRGAFPTENEFKDAGRRPLFTAMHGHGGLAYWRERVGVKGPA
ncbi:MAG: recombinase family protein [Solirubrobacterales bacterium]